MRSQNALLAPDCIASRLRCIAMGTAYYQSALSEALARVTCDAHRQVLKRYIAGTQTAVDHILLQEIAMEIDRAAQ